MKYGLNLHYHQSLGQNKRLMNKSNTMYIAPKRIEKLIQS